VWLSPFNCGLNVRKHSTVNPVLFCVDTKTITVRLLILIILHKSSCMLYFFMLVRMQFFMLFQYLYLTDFRSYYTKALSSVICKILTKVTVYNTVLYAALSSYPQFIANNKNVWSIIFFIPFTKSSDLLFKKTTFLQAALRKTWKTK
jgi:hypothetical protein